MMSIIVSHSAQGLVKEGGRGGVGGFAKAKPSQQLYLQTNCAVLSSCCRLFQTSKVHMLDSGRKSHVHVQKFHVQLFQNAQVFASERLPANFAAFPGGIVH